MQFGKSEKHIYQTLKLCDLIKGIANLVKEGKLTAYIGNPVIATQEQYYELEELLHEIHPDCRSIQLRTERLIIENISLRTFQYPRNPSIEWVAGRLQYMVGNGL